MVERAPQNDCCQRAVLVVIQLLSHVWLFVTSWTASRQAPLTFAIYWSLLKFMSIKLMMPSNHLILCHLLLLLPSIFPSIRVFSNESVLCIRWPKYWSFSFSISPSNDNQDWFPLRLTGLIALLSKGLSRVFSSRQFKSISSLVLSIPFGPTLSSPYMTTGKTIDLTVWTFVGKVMSLLFNILSRFVIASVHD